MERSFATQSRIAEPNHWDSPPPEPIARRGNVLILTSATGAGHDSVAAALKQAMCELAPDVRVRVLDPLGTRRNGPLSAGRWYDTMTAHAPWLWGLLYKATNNARTVRLGMAIGGKLWARRLRSAIQTERPSIIVSVHPLCTRLAAGILRDMPAAPPLHCVVTDLVTVHQCWASDAVATFYVATSDACDTLVAMGIAPERVHVTGLPLRAAFARTPRASTAGGATRVLLLGGGHPSRQIEKVARALVMSRLPLRLVIVCGRNTRLRRRLIRGLGDRATVLGWRDDIAALMRWSSVVITKGGPTTVAEALSQARPVVISHALPGQEAGNVMLVTRTGSGRYLPDVDALVRTVAARSCTWSEGTGTQPDWWGGAARRVATSIVAGCAQPSAELGESARQNDARAGGMRILGRRPALAATIRQDRSAPADIFDTYIAGQDVTGRLIVNPISGERIIIRQSGAETGGKLLCFDHFLPPGGHVPARHAHPNQEERFTIMEGQMRFRLGRRRVILARPGETVVVPAGTAHWFGNAGTGVSHARVEVRPALRMEELFESAAAMNVARYIPGATMPRLSELAIFLSEFQPELAVPDMPAFLIKAVMAPFAWLGRRRGRAATRVPAG
jgi:1,2-diacylglycerol 3-beta-galactosyltransferase